MEKSNLLYSSRKVQEGCWDGPLAKVTCLRSSVSPRSGYALVSPLSAAWGAVWLWCHCSDEFQNATAEAVGQWCSLWEEIWEVPAHDCHILCCYSCATSLILITKKDSDEWVYPCWLNQFWWVGIGEFLISCCYKQHYGGKPYTQVLFQERVCYVTTQRGIIAAKHIWICNFNKYHQIVLQSMYRYRSPSSNPTMHESNWLLYFHQHSTWSSF